MSRLQLALVIFQVCLASSQRPNIVFILIDDLGWNDVGFHGSDEIPTPNIDALAYSGVILNEYYTAPVCTPSRSAIMTGKHPIHTGLQHDILFAGEPRGLPLKEKLLPQYLKEVGYSTHALGKWHLGFYKKEYTPTYRGFDSFLGCWTGHQDYYEHTAVEHAWGLDMRRGLEPAWDLHGVYTTDLLTSEAVSIIDNHNTSSPLFIYLAHVALHSANPHDPLQAPDDVVARFANITDYKRRKYAGMVTKVDDSVGDVVQALKEKGMLSNTIIVFSTDNGGSAGGFNRNVGSNWPLRGVKGTLWEGGVRGAALFWTSSVQPGVSYEKFHLTDWLPTLLTAVNYSKAIDNLDGVDAWDTITKGTPSKRENVLHTIDDTIKSFALTSGDWKIFKAGKFTGWDDIYLPTGRADYLTYDIDSIIKSSAGQALSSIGKPLNPETISDLRSRAVIKCVEKELATPCVPGENVCLFNIKDDPCEYDNLAESNPSIVERLMNEIDDFNKTAVPPANLPIDPASNPNFWGHTWNNFGDFPSPVVTNKMEF